MKFLRKLKRIIYTVFLRLRLFLKGYSDIRSGDYYHAGRLRRELRRLKWYNFLKRRKIINEFRK